MQKIDYIMVTVSDMTRSVEFYRHRLGLGLKFASPDWTEFESGGTTLVLHGGGQQRGQVDEVETGPKYAGTCSIGFSVQNVEQIYRELLARDVIFTMPPTLQEKEGIQLAVCVDPDGLPISFAETVQNAQAQAGP